MLCPNTGRSQMLCPNTGRSQNVVGNNEWSQNVVCQKYQIEIDWIVQDNLVITDINIFVVMLCSYHSYPLHTPELPVLWKGGTGIGRKENQHSARNWQNFVMCLAYYFTSYWRATRAFFWLLDELKNDPVAIQQVPRNSYLLSQKSAFCCQDNGSTYLPKKGIFILFPKWMPFNQHGLNPCPGLLEYPQQSSDKCQGEICTYNDPWTLTSGQRWHKVRQGSQIGLPGCLVLSKVNLDQLVYNFSMLLYKYLLIHWLYSMNQDYYPKIQKEKGNAFNAEVE